MKCTINIFITYNCCCQIISLMNFSWAFHLCCPLFFVHLPLYHINHHDDSIEKINNSCCSWKSCKCLKFVPCSYLMQHFHLFGIDLVESGSWVCHSDVFHALVGWKYQFNKTSYIIACFSAVVFHLPILLFRVCILIGHNFFFQLLNHIAIW